MFPTEESSAADNVAVARHATSKIRKACFTTESSRRCALHAPDDRRRWLSHRAKCCGTDGRAAKRLSCSSARSATAATAESIATRATAMKRNHLFGSVSFYRLDSAQRAGMAASLSSILMAPVLSSRGSPLWTCVVIAPNRSIVRPIRAAKKNQSTIIATAAMISATRMNFKNVIGYPDCVKKLVMNGMEKALPMPVRKKVTATPIRIAARTRGCQRPPDGIRGEEA